MWIAALLNSVRAGWRDVARRTELPGYEQLSYSERWLLDLRAWIYLWADASWWRLLLWTIAYLLAIHVVVWHLALQRRVADLLILLALVWLLPCVARLRRAGMRRLLGPQWPAD
jgi:hypothetical protein